MSCSCSKASTHQARKAQQPNSDTSIAENSSRPLENLTPSEIECENDDFVAENSSRPLVNLTPSEIECKKIDFVAAIYQGKWYIGQVCDLASGEVEINFMLKNRQSFQWSSQKDQIWIVKKDILCTMPSPVPTGSSNRMFKFDDDAIQSVEQNFQAHMQNC
ncbi:hypothetical protein DPMN_168180 [Dreissena polymorpha]|uniref:Uncharacterized protein n=1 Tax=Dreissena polymorpha TaxID=45954 RepID=A0A9D4F1A3_DREPO|nr:hypothetical protein DPMN_168180 [Dreissena polymorpha]